jgi:hypothetical protein
VEVHDVRAGHRHEPAKVAHLVAHGTSRGTAGVPQSMTGTACDDVRGKDTVAGTPHGDRPTSVDLIRDEVGDDPSHASRRRLCDVQDAALHRPAS